MALHKDLEGEAAIHQFAYVSGVDPGAIGPFRAWVDISTVPARLKVRNATDDGWIEVGGALDSSEPASSGNYPHAADYPHAGDYPHGGEVVALHSYPPDFPSTTSYPY